MSSEKKIYQPIKVGKREFKNRIYIGPHGSGLHERGGGIGDKMMAFLRNQARSGVSMVTIGSGNINPTAGPFPVAHPADFSLICNYGKVPEMFHQYDCKVCMQLFPSKEMMTPSAKVVAEATKESIQDLCNQYANAAFNCMQAGFDYIMIHGAHGNGPSMFFSPLYNHRTDEYGGSLENRARFALEVLDAIRAKCGDGIGIEYRLSAEEIVEGGSTIEENIEFAKLIQDKIDILHISRGLLEEDSHLPYVFTPTYFERGINLKYAKRFKEAVKVPVSVVGGFDLETAEEAVENGDVDMVVIVRSSFADTDIVTKKLRGQEDTIRPCIRCNVCIATTHARLWDIRCSVNPLFGRESQFPTYKYYAPVSKKVMLIGGGPANLEAARIASMRGHRVVLCEAGESLGGALKYATTAPFKADLKKYMDWSIRMVERDPNIEVRLNTEVTPEYLKVEAPDAVIIAVGGKPIIPNLSALNTDKVKLVNDVELDSSPLGNDVIVAGGGFTGLECALSLSMQGKQVRVVDMLPEKDLGKGGTHMNTVGLLELLRKNNVEFISDAKIEDVTKDGIIISKGDEKKTLDCDNVVLALGTKKDAEQVEALRKVIPETYVIGDCSNVGGTVRYAVHSGFDMAMEL